ncbi:calmodulin-binding protein 60 A-like isoform X3 [Solanum lycopersicum]|uniref:calmodulin-binding protein 60 A-like isoform X3 n=1 Tax=Solanum lycopersicum TaxID=4081 RepID=UPI003749707C
MAVDMFEEGNSTSHTETTNSNTPPFTRLLQILVAFLLALWSASPIQVEDESHSELEEILTDQNRINSQKKLDPCESRCLCLKFSHEIVAPLVFTGECIFPNGTKLELVDAATGQQVRHGPLASSAQIEICVLNDENWTIEELNSHIMVQTRGCDQNPYLRLEGGVVSVNEIKFKHTPKHMKKLDVVKLGARVVDETEVIEAVTGPFTVKDQRLKSKKRYPPSPTDHVWSLEHICKYGAFHKRLTESGIKTVEDFLIELQNNPQRLRHILGRSMSENYWKKVTKHAKTCNLDGRKYLYHHLETEQKFTVAFDVAGQVMWLDSGCGLLHFNMLPENQKGTTETYRSAECSTSYAFVDRQSVSDEMSVAITSPGHSGFGPWGYQNSPNDIISAISESGDWEELMQYLSSDAIQFDDFLYRELGQTNNSVAETIATQFHQLQHGVAMDLLQNQFMVSENVHNEDSTNTNQQCPMNNVSIVPEASTCKDKYKKIWIKITSIVKWLALNRFVKLKKVRMTKKRKSISK